MKKTAILLLLLCLTVGCTLISDKASDPVKEYLQKYNNHDAEIEVELESLIKNENLTDEQGEKYKEIMKKQYDDLKYEVEEEIYNGEEATVKTKITVYDLYTAQMEAENYKMEHTEEFLNQDGTYNPDIFLNYKLEKMKKQADRKEYEIDFKVIKKDGKWTLETVSTKDLEKIHGIYNYEGE